MANTYATWNPSDKNANVTLSNGNLTAVNSNTGGSWMPARSTIGVSSGKWYWEITIQTTEAAFGISNGAHGIANASASIADGARIGNDANGWSYYGNAGNKINNGAETAYGASFNNGDVIGVALDMGAGTITFYKNNSSQGQAFSGLSGTIYAATSPYNMIAQTTNSGQITANFGATALTYTPPVGFNAGLYTTSASSGAFLEFM